MEEEIKTLEDFIDAVGEEYGVVREKQALENLIKEFKKIKIENIEYRLGQTPDTTADYKDLKKELEKWKKT